MEVILAKDFTALGFVGDRVAVKNGYARNYLIPKGIAVEAASRNARELKHKLHQINAHKAKMKSEAEEVASKLNLLSFEFTLKIGAQGKSFGSLGTKDIEKYLAEQGFDISRKQITLTDQVKSGGQFPFSIKLHSEVTVPLTMKVKVDIPATKKKEEPKEVAEPEADAEELEALAEME